MKLKVWNERGELVTQGMADVTSAWMPPEDTWWRKGPCSPHFAIGYRKKWKE